MENNQLWDDKVNASFESIAEEFDKEVESFPTIDEIQKPQQSVEQIDLFANQPMVEERRVQVEPQPVVQPQAPVQQTVVEHKVEQQPVQAPNPRDFLKNMKFDLSQITMVEASPIEEVNNFEFVLNNKSKTQIVANQSNYIAYMESLNYNEISALTNSTLDDFASQVLLAQTIHSKINTTSVGKLSYEQWIAITSHYDIDSFLYGIYIQTFPGDTKFNITCGHCKDNIEAVVNNDTLISGKNESTYANLQELLNNHNNAKDLINKALVNSTQRVLLPDSKIIVDIKLPTIKKHLDLVGSVNKNVKDKTSHILSLMIFLEKMLMVDVKKSMQSGTPCYYEVKEREKIARVISQLSFDDAKAFSKAIEDMVEKYAVEYKIKSFKCPKCHEELGEIPVDMETLLFYQILQL